MANTSTVATASTNQTASTTAQAHVQPMTLEYLLKQGVPEANARAIMAAHEATVKASIDAIPKGRRDGAEVAQLRKLHAKLRLIAMCARCNASDMDVQIAHTSEVATRKRDTNYTELAKLAQSINVSTDKINQLRHALSELVKTF